MPGADSRLERDSNAYLGASIMSNMTTLSAITLPPNCHWSTTTPWDKFTLNNLASVVSEEVFLAEVSQRSSPTCASCDGGKLHTCLIEGAHSTNKTKCITLKWRTWRVCSISITRTIFGNNPPERYSPNKADRHTYGYVGGNYSSDIELWVYAENGVLDCCREQSHFINATHCWKLFNYWNLTCVWGKFENWKSEKKMDSHE